MRIYGNFELPRGRWSEPDPGFYGHIIVWDDGKFVGYHDELYGGAEGMEFLDNEVNNLRFITGYITKNGHNGAEGIAFLKLSLDRRQSPIVYFVPDLEKGLGAWSTSDPRKNPNGRAKLVVEEVPDDDAVSTKINDLYLRMTNDTDFVNRHLLDKVEACQAILEHRE